MGVLDKVDPVDLASRIGDAWYSDVGKMALPEMEISYILASLGRNKYHGSEGRVRKHIFLYWGKGWYKSSILKGFFERLTDGKESAEQMLYFRDDMEYFNMGRMTLQKLTGSISEKGYVIYPLVNRPNFLVSSELMSTLESSGDRKAFTEYMLEALEEGTGSVSLVKMAGKEPKPTQAEEMECRGIKFNYVEGIMSYPVRGTFMVATRDLNKRDWTRLDESGFVDRFQVLRWQPMVDEFMRVESHIPRPLPRSEDQLKRYNSEFWKIEWFEPKAPPLNLVSECKSIEREKRMRLIDLHGLPYDSLASGRTINFINQYLTASAMIQAPIRVGIQDSYDEIPYEEEDIGFFKDRIDGYLRQKLYSDLSSKSRQESGELLVLYQKVWARLGLDMNGTRIKMQKEAIDALMSTEGINSRSAATRKLKKLISEGWVVVQGKTGPNNAKVLRFVYEVR